jgi:antitoxin YefM
MKTVTATSARGTLFRIIKGAARGHFPVRITHPTGSIVLMSEDDYEGLLETLELLSIPGFRESLKRSIKQAAKGETFSMEEAFAKRK